MLFLALFRFMSMYTTLCKECADQFPHIVTHTGSHRCVLLPRRTACLCAFMAVSSDVSQPSVTQSSGFSLFVPFNSVQCTDVTEQPGEQETEAK